VAQPDPIKRFTETPLEAKLGLLGANILLETNCPTVVDKLSRALGQSTVDHPHAPSFVLRVVSEADADPEPIAACDVHRMSYQGLSFANVGQKSFVVCDRQARLGIAFVSETLLADEKQFEKRFLPALISLLTESIEVT
jgi:hypothetical protein